MPIAPSASPTVVHLDADGRIVTDVQCLRCRYNLRTLGVRQTCPACGFDVWRSIHGDLLRYADPRWVRRVALGGALLLIAGLLLVCWREPRTDDSLVRGVAFWSAMVAGVSGCGLFLEDALPHLVWRSWALRRR